MASPIYALATLAGFSVSARRAPTGAPITLFFATSSSSGSDGATSDASDDAMMGRHRLVESFRTVSEPADSALAGCFRKVRRYKVIMEVPREGEPPALWVSPNSLSNNLPPPPDTTQGPYACFCEDLDGQHGPRYGAREADSWLWSPDHYDATWSYRPYIPDLFEGEGPCFRRKYVGILTQWEPAWAVKDQSRVRLRSHEKGLIAFITNVIQKAMSALAMTLPGPAPDVATAANTLELQEAWARWVGYRQVCVGMILERMLGLGRVEDFQRQHARLFEEMTEAQFFEHPPLGAWFRDTDARLEVVRSFVALGIPVFYRWSPRLDEIFTARSLRPSDVLMGHLAALRPRRDRSVIAPPVRASMSAPTKDNTTDNSPFEMVETPAIEASSEESRKPPPPYRTLLKGPAYPWDDKKGARLPPVRRGSDASLMDVPWWGANEADLHVEGFEQGVEQGIDLAARRLATSSGRPLEEARALLSAVPKVEYALARDSLLKGRISAHPGGAKKDAVIMPLVLAVFSDYAQYGPPTGNPNITVVMPANDASLPELERRMLDQRPSGFKIFVYDVGVVDEQLRKLIRDGHFMYTEDLVAFCLRNLIRFTTGIPRAGGTAMELSAEASVHASWWVTPRDGTGDMLEQWRKTLTFLFEHRPRVFRAAIARGGLLARIARATRDEGRFTLLPSTATRSLGCPEPLESEGKKYHVDWLDKEEILVLTGSTGPSASYGASLWPPLDLFDARYAGVWTKEYEGWFKSRFRELVTGLRGDKPARGLCKPTEWEALLKNSAFA